MSNQIKLKWNDGKVKEMSREACTAGAYAGGIYLRRAADATVPRGKTGALAASCVVTARPKTGKAIVRYKVVYAHYVHEAPGLHFAPPGRSKWLQHTTEEQARQIGDAMAVGLRSTWR